MVPLIPVFGRLRQGDCCEYKANLSYSVSSAIKVITILIRAGDIAQFVECLPLIPVFDPQHHIKWTWLLWNPDTKKMEAEEGHPRLHIKFGASLSYRVQCCKTATTI